MVERLTKAKPTTGEMPRDSLMAQMTCWSLPARVDAAVLGRPVLGLPLLLQLVSGRGVVVLKSLGYEVEADAYDTRGSTLGDMVK